MQKKDSINFGLVVTVGIFAIGFMIDASDALHDHEALECHPTACEKLDRIEDHLELQTCILKAEIRQESAVECLL